MSEKYGTGSKHWQRGCTDEVRRRKGGRRGEGAGRQTKKRSRGRDGRRGPREDDPGRGGEGRGHGGSGESQEVSRQSRSLSGNSRRGSRILGLLLWHLGGGGAATRSSGENAVSAAVSSEGEGEAALRGAERPRGKMAASLHGQQAGDFRKGDQPDVRSPRGFSGQSRNARGSRGGLSRAMKDERREPSLTRGDEMRWMQGSYGCRCEGGLRRRVWRAVGSSSAFWNLEASSLGV